MECAMKNLTIVIALFVAILGFANSASAKEVTLVVTAPANQVYTAALQVVNGLDGYEIKDSDREAGFIAAEHKTVTGEANQFMDIEIIKAGDSQTEVNLNVRKRRLSISGGNVDERIKEFHSALVRRLGDKVTVTVRDGK